MVKLTGASSSRRFTGRLPGGDSPDEVTERAGDMSKEILSVVEVVSAEKGVAKDIIFEAIEAALASATRKRHPEDLDVRVSIDRETGDYETFRRWEIVDDASVVFTQEEADAALEKLLAEAGEGDGAAEGDGEQAVVGPGVFDPNRQILYSDSSRAPARIRAWGFRRRAHRVGGVRPDRRADRQAGHRAEGARGRTRAGHRGLSESGGRDGDRSRQASGTRRHHPRSRRQRRGDRQPRGRHPARDRAPGRPAPRLSEGRAP